MSVRLKLPVSQKKVHLSDCELGKKWVRSESHDTKSGDFPCCGFTGSATAGGAKSVSLTGMFVYLPGFFICVLCGGINSAIQL
jgi:hypothetical protein